MNDNKIKIWTNDYELTQINECLPKPAHHFLPDWWKKTPLFDPDLNNSIANTTSQKRTIRKCPALHEYLSQGVIIPMWCDVYLAVDKNNKWSWKTPNSKYTWGVHEKNQFLDHSPNWVADSISAVFKANCPWYIKTSQDCAVYQMPLFYHFNKNYTVMPATIQTDVHHEIHQQVLFHSKESEIIIERGTPFVAYIPYKREEFILEIKTGGEQEQKELAVSNANYSTKFTNGYKGHTDKICPVKIKG
jgi:hypothetical protein